MKEDIVGSNIQSPQHATKLHAIGETNERHRSPHLQLLKSVNSYRMTNAVSCQSPSVGSSHTLKSDFEIEVVQPDMYSPTVKQAPIKFHTAGGRSISVSNDALQRARSLLGDPDLGDFFDGGDASDSIFSLPNERQTNTTSSCDGNDCDTPLIQQITSESNHMTKYFMLPLLSSRKKDAKFLCEGSGNNLIMKFDAVGNQSDYSLKSSIICGQKPLHDENQAPDSTPYHSSLNGFSSKIDPPRMSSGRPLVDISNTINIVHTNNRQPASGKRRLGSHVIVSPFKRPRNSKISVPYDYDQDIGACPNGKHILKFLIHSFLLVARPIILILMFVIFRFVSIILWCFGMQKKGFYPISISVSKDAHQGFFCSAFIRSESGEYSLHTNDANYYLLLGPHSPCNGNILYNKISILFQHIPNQVRQVTSGNAEKYMFHDGFGESGIGAEAFVNLLAHHGASTHFASKE